MRWLLYQLALALLSSSALSLSWSVSSLQAQRNNSPDRPANWAQPMQVEGVPNLFKVSDRLYRSAQPTADGMRQLKQLGIATVLNLRAFHSDDDEIGETGLTSQQISMLAWYPQQQEAIDFLKLLTNPQHQPLLVHCQHGADRTGAMIALYRIALEGWSKEAAIQEMVDGGYGFHAIWFNLPQWIRDLDVDAVCRAAGVQPAKQRTIRPDVFVIEVLDDETKIGVPLVELETIAHNRYVTDSAGCIAITDLDLMGRKVFFTVHSHGYQFNQDGFGMRGTALEVKGGQRATLFIKRQNLAQRMFRLTGSGIFVDSVRAGLLVPDTPLVNGDVVGCDSVMTAIYGGKIYWFWGDTNRPHYPLGGNFHITAATTPIDLACTIDQGPPRFDYLVDDRGAIRSVAKMPGDGPTWISAVTVLPAKTKAPAAQSRLMANYVKVRKQLEAYRWGFVVWDDQTQQFTEVNSTQSRPSMFPDGQVHTFVHDDYVYFNHPLPLTRVAATEEAFIDPSQYEGWSCLKSGTTLADKQLDRNEHGQLIFGWKQNTPPLTQAEQRQLIKDGLMTTAEAHIRLIDRDSGREVQAHSGSVTWNKYRNSWLMIAVEFGGENSVLGDVWIAEAPKLEGPWLNAVKVATHHQYSFYNPKQHAFLDSDDGRTIYFEGTYTTTFSGNPQATPRYDYNQILYRLNLDKVWLPK